MDIILLVFHHLVHSYKFDWLSGFDWSCPLEKYSGSLGARHVLTHRVIFFLWKNYCPPWNKPFYELLCMCRTPLLSSPSEQACCLAASWMLWLQYFQLPTQKKYRDKEFFFSLTFTWCLFVPDLTPRYWSYIQLGNQHILEGSQKCQCSYFSHKMCTLNIKI